MPPKTTKEAAEKASALRTTVDYTHGKSHKHKHGFCAGLPRPQRVNDTILGVVKCSSKMMHFIACNKHKTVFHIVKLFFKKRLFDFIDCLALTLLKHILNLEPLLANVVTHASNSTLLNIIKFPGKSNW